MLLLDLYWIWSYVTVGIALLTFHFIFVRKRDLKLQLTNLCDHIKLALFELHWLPVHFRIESKLCLLMHSATVQCCPSYISDIVQTTATSSRQQGIRPLTQRLCHIQSCQLLQKV